VANKSESASLPTIHNAAGLNSLPVPHSGDLGMPHFLLQLENPIHERLGRGRASRDVNIDRHDPVAATSNAVAVVVVSAPIGATTHADHPSKSKLVLDHAEVRSDAPRFWHLEND